MLLTTAMICLAANIYHEARSEPLLGQFAVAQVTMARAEGNEENVCEVVLKPKQFSWTTGLVRNEKLKPAGLPKESEAWQLALAVAGATLKFNELFGKTWDATHYHANHVSPYWSKSMVKIASIGAHSFYR